jgi:hypothetical protein
MERKRKRGMLFYKRCLLGGNGKWGEIFFPGKKKKCRDESE